MINTRIFLLINTILLVSILSCSKDESADENLIPYVQVKERLNINDPLYSKLNNINSWVYVNAGSRGIILFRESNETIRAFDRHCTYDPEQVCSTVDMDAGLLQANDFDCCGSIFGIATRVVLKGPASRPLVEYDCTFDGTFIVISN